MLRLPNLLKSSPKGEANLLFSSKLSKGSGEKSNSLITYFSKSNSLISTFTCPVDYEKQKSDCKSPLFAYVRTSQGVKH